MKEKVLDIFNTKYKILFVDRIDTDNEDAFIFGDTDSRRCTIRIATKDIDNNPIDKVTMETTLLHEIIHAVLNEGQYKTCSNDEQLVEWLAKCLYSIKNQEIV